MDQDSIEKATKLKAKKNLDMVIDKGKTQQPPSFVSHDNTSFINSSKSLGVVLGCNDYEILNSINLLKDVEYNRLVERASSRVENCDLVDDTSTVCSNDDSIDLEAINLICSDIAEGLGDEGCDPLILQSPVPYKNKERPKKHMNKNKVSSR